VDLPAEFRGAVLRQSDDLRRVFLYEFKDVGYIEVHPGLRNLDVFFEDGVNIGDFHFSERSIGNVLENAYKLLRNHILLKIGEMQREVEMYQRMEDRYRGYLQDLAKIDGEKQVEFDFWCTIRGE
jgi:hypothetical protein